MSWNCNKPLKAYARDVDGKVAIVFASSFDAPYVEKNGLIYDVKMEIPCAKCSACKLEFDRLRKEHSKRM